MLVLLVVILNIEVSLALLAKHIRGDSRLMLHTILIAHYDWESLNIDGQYPI